VKRAVGNAPKEVADIFSGTGVVSAAFKANGFAVSANDHLATCFNLTSAILLNNHAPSFAGLEPQITSLGASPYLSVLQFLNSLPERSGGFIHTHYSPASLERLGYERRYFTEINAARIDTVRAMICHWHDLLTPQERALLLTDLVRAVSAVSNVAGTYGCYLKQWKSRARDILFLKPSYFVPGCYGEHSVTSMDVQEALKIKATAIVYADPPYTKRQYAAYYHVLDTIVRSDNPQLVGTTGLRNWETHSSDFCYKRKAEGAMERLLNATDCEHFFLSYNDDGQISHARLLDLLGAFGKTSVQELSLKRYRSSSLPHKGPTVAERLSHVRMQ
ncbi:DNA adenine methylase, partial [Pseudomonas viridiflava]|uniref:DNA adenine methylase n=1 Tax=Pseudomonas viridiflava TaxID=33069 RepID=UPI0013DEF0B9